MPVYQRRTPTPTALDAYDAASSSANVIGAEANSAVQPTQLLTAEQASASVIYNSRKSIPAAAWQQVAAVVGSTDTSLTPALVQEIARWQAKVGLDADGKCGDITMEWLSHETAGEGLDTYVQRETTLFMGLNPESKGVEFDTLKGQIGSQLIGAMGSGQQHQDQVQVSGKWASLTSDEGLQEALSLLPGLPPAKATQIIAYLAATGDNARDEMFGMIRALWTAESGAGLLKRVVISGHSSGDYLWGGHDMEFGSMSYTHLLGVFKMFPRAAAQVEDIAFSACFSGMTDGMDRYRAIFPNLKTAWGYADYSPSAATGSTRHLSKWDQGTRGPVDDGIEKARTDVAKGSGPRDQNVAIWSEDGGYQTNVGKAGMSMEDLRNAVDRQRPVYDAAYLQGNINQTALDALQGDLQTLVRMHGTALGGARAEYALMNVRTLFLRHWSTITSGFVGRHGEDMKAAYSELGRALPDFTRMSRTEILALIKNFSATGEKSTKAKKLLEEVLRDLDPAQVPYGQGSVNVN